MFPAQLHIINLLFKFLSYFLDVAYNLKHINQFNKIILMIVQTF